MDQVQSNSGGLSGLGLLFLLVVGAMTWGLPRQKALVPILITTGYMPLGQMLVIAGFHFQILRILLIVGWCRVWSRKESKDLILTRLDRLFIWWALASLILGTLAKLSPERFFNLCGDGFNAVGTFFLFRCWIREVGEVIAIVRFLAVMITPLALSMVVEKSTAHNIFSVFGGVPEITVVREGKLRCQGAFMHPILAGTYAATLFPFFVGLWFAGGRDRRRATIGACSAAVVTVAANSSGALLALVFAVIGFACWRIRRHMRLLRWGIVLTVLALAMVMKAPVWYLIARVSDITGGTGWHRAYLIDQAVNHFDEWWLVGTTYTAHWAPAGQVLAVDRNNMDITNHYIAEGVHGGILKLGLFIAMIVFGYKTIGRWMKTPAMLKLPQGMFIWSLGVCLLTHCVSFISVCYFDQIITMWYLLLAVISMLASELPHAITLEADGDKTEAGAFQQGLELASAREDCLNIGSPKLDRRVALGLRFA
jgi:hypothetical protein